MLALEGMTRARECMEALDMTDKMLFSLSIFLTGLGAGIALAAFVAPHSRSAKGRLTGFKSEEDLLKSEAASSSH
jgi:hypothetical protein